MVASDRVNTESEVDVPMSRKAGKIKNNLSIIHMSDTRNTEILEEEEKETPSEPHIPEVAKKVSKFGNPGGMSKFGK
jgi:hypothetical protein